MRDSRWGGQLAPEVESVPIASLVAADSPRREGENAEHARTLAQSETPFPPIIVQRSSMKVIDGIHRLHASILRGWKDIDVRFFDGGEQDAFVLAVESNVQHGLPLTLSDRTAAAERIVLTHPQWSDRAVAAATGLAAKTVAAIRRRSATEEVPQLHTRIGRDGKTRPVNSAEGRRRAGVLLKENPGTSLRKIAEKAGVSPNTVRDVRQRLQANEDPVPPRHRRPVQNAVRKAPAAMGDGATGVPARELDAKTAIQALLRDPQLRMCTEGRLLLRLFAVHLDRRQRQRLIDWIPSRWRRIVTELAYARSRDWYQFAKQVEASEGKATVGEGRVLEGVG